MAAEINPRLGCRTRLHAAVTSRLIDPGRRSRPGHRDDHLYEHRRRHSPCGDRLHLERGSSHGSGSNPDSKLQLLRHASKRWAARPSIRTHWLNHQSREAISRLGAKQDGVLRKHSGRDGTLRTPWCSRSSSTMVHGPHGLEFRLASSARAWTALMPRPPSVEDRALSRWPDPYNASTRLAFPTNNYSPDWNLRERPAS